MLRTIEFKNFVHTYTQISADLYLEGNFIVTLTTDIMNIKEILPTQIGLYEFFKQAAITYLHSSGVNYSFKSNSLH